LNDSKPFLFMETPGEVFLNRALSREICCGGETRDVDVK
jgi:hypothetical protein